MKNAMPRSKRVKRVIRCVLVCAAMSVLFISIVDYLPANGGESLFSPQAFRLRAMSYLYIPCTNIKLSSRLDREFESPLFSGLQQRGYPFPITHHPVQWDRITSWNSTQRLSANGMAKQFWYGCDCYSEEHAQQWIEWTDNHPDFARDLWPRVLELVACGQNEGNYARAAMLMRMVKSTKNKVEYDRAISEFKAQYTK